MSPPDHGSAHDISMNLAGRQSTHSFKDLRSARHARNHNRTRREKYYHFKGLTPSDLPSSDHQTTHYLPVCRLDNCPTFGTVDGCWWATFPADLDSAPRAKFTKREAYEQAQLWPRPPTYHHSGQNDKYRWPGRKYEKSWDEKRETRRGLARFSWADKDDNDEGIERVVEDDKHDEWLCGWFAKTALAASPEHALEALEEERAQRALGDLWVERHGTERAVRAEDSDLGSSDWEVLSDVSDISWVDLTVDDR